MKEAANRQSDKEGNKADMMTLRAKYISGFRPTFVSSKDSRDALSGDGIIAS